MAKECRPEGQDWQILRQVSPTQSLQSHGAAEKAVSTVRGLAGTYDKTLSAASVDDKTRSMDSRCNVRRDTRMTPYEKTRGQTYRKEILPLGEQVLARRPGASVNQLLQPWATGFWLGRDTLSDEHVTGRAAGVMRSRALRRACSNERNALHTVVPTSESSRPPSFAETSI